MRNLLALLLLVAVSGSIQSQTIDEWYLAYSGPSSHTIAQLPAGSYTLKVSGIFCGGSCWGENGTDAAYSLPSQNPFSGRSFTINEYCPQGWEGSGDCAFLRPTPDVYSPAHEYHYLIDHTGGDFIVFGLADECCWGDNTGGLAFELFPSDPTGCTDVSACNYNPEASTDDGSCLYPEPTFDCDGNLVLPPFIPNEGLVAWYPFNGDTENVAGEDDTLATTSTDWTTDRYGMDSSAIAFPALNSHAFGSLLADFQNNQYSYALWWRIDGAFSYNGYNLLTYPNPSPGNLASNALSYTIEENWYWMNCPDASSGYASSARIGLDHTLRALDCAVLEDMEQWNHSVVTVDSTMMRLYFNGALIETVTVDLNMSDFLGETLVLGARNNPTQNSVTTRILDDVGIWNRALNEEEVQALFMGTPPESGCLDSAACNFDSAATADDGSCEYGCLYCGEGTVWNSTLAQCISTADTIYIEPAAGAPSCGEGTVWDPVNEECIIAIPADLNYDGCVTVNDLLVLLTVHGTCPPYPEWPDEPTDTIWACGDPLTYWDYDYSTVLIGDQCWFAENARYLSYVSPPDVGWEDDGEPHAYVVGYSGTSVDEAMAVSEYTTYGALYNFAAVEDSEMCPSGWHVPTASEWDELENFIGLLSADQLKAAPPVWDGTNELGFNAIRVPVRISSGSFGAFNVKADFWTSTSFDDNIGWGRELNSGQNFITHDGNGKNAGQPVRCIQD